MDIELILILVVMVIVTVFDAVRDAWVVRKDGIGWWHWHVVKWVAMYCPFVLLTYFYFSKCHFDLLEIVVFWVVCLVCWVVWKVVYLVSSSQSTKKMADLRSAVDSQQSTIGNRRSCGLKTGD